MDTLLQDLRSGLRILTKSPGPAAAAVLVLAIGIGLATAMFSIINGIIFRGLPFEEGERILALSQRLGDDSLPIHDYLDWREQQTTFEDLTGFFTLSVYIASGESAERYDGARISANAFAQLRIKPHLGSFFTEDHDQPGAEPVILLGYHVWRDRYGSDPKIVGQSLAVDGIPTTVLGIMPERFQFPNTQDVWQPLQADVGDTKRGHGLYVGVFGRLKEGVTQNQAQQEMSLIAQRLEQAYPETNEGLGANVMTYTRQSMGEDRHQLGYTSLGAVTFVLLIACSNVANLLLARTSMRSRELAVRTALGASRGRIIRQILSESLFLAVPASAFGLILASWGVREFNKAVAGQDWPYWFDVRISSASLIVVLLLTTLSTLASGLLPAWRASRLDVHGVLKNESRAAIGASGRLSKGLVIVQVALSCVLLVGAGLMVRSIINLASIDFAFETKGLFTARMGLPTGTYPTDESRIQYWNRLHEELQSVPGVRSVALADVYPGADRAQGAWYGNADKTYSSDEEHTWSRRATITPGFFETFGVAVTGRDFNRQDVADTDRVVIVNQSLADREWPEESAMGKRLRFGRTDSKQPWMTVIGVVPDLHMDGLRNQSRAGLYVPAAQTARTHLGIVALTDGPPLALTSVIRDRVRNLDSSLPVYSVESMDGLIAQSKFFFHLIGVMFSIVALAALALAAVGLYSVLAFSMSRRTAEVGIRMALGAAARNVVKMVVSQGLRQVVVGLVLGLLAAAGTAQLMSSQLYGVEALDPLTFGVIAALIVIVAVAAALIPATRAARISPVQALRHS